MGQNKYLSILYRALQFMLFIELLLISMFYIENTTEFFCSPLYKRIFTYAIHIKIRCNALHRIILTNSFVSFLMDKSLINTSMPNIEHTDKSDEDTYYKYGLSIKKNEKTTCNNKIDNFIRGFSLFIT